MNKKLRIAIIGAGTISQSIHIPTVLRADMELVAICDLSPSKVTEIAKRYNVKTTIEVNEILADKTIDAVIIATPGSHAQLAMSAILHGKHVLAEKPLALTIAEINALEVAANKNNVVLQVGYMKMYDPLIGRARREIASLKDIKLVRITVAHPDDHPQIAHLRMSSPIADVDIETIKTFNDYEYNQSKIALPQANDSLLAYYRNVLNGSVIHELSLLRALDLPLPENWQAQVFPEDAIKTGNEPACLLATALVENVQYILSWNWLPDYPEYEEELAIFASNGRLHLSMGKPYLLEERSSLRVQTHDQLERQDTTYTETFETGFLRQLDAFYNSIRHNAPVIANASGAKQDIQCLQALVSAISQSMGRPIKTECEETIIT